MRPLTCIVLLFCWSMLTACKKEEARANCVEGTVLGPGCLTGSFAIRIQGKNRHYGIEENATYDDLVETMNLPDAYRVSGTRLYFTFAKATNESAQYLTYCTPAPQITLLSVFAVPCPSRERK